MKTKLSAAFIVMIAGCCLFSCKDSSTSPDTPSGKTVVGSWQEIILKVPLVGLNSDIIINMNIKDTDSTFLMEIIEDDDKDTLYLQYGTWTLNTHPTTPGTDYAMYLYGDMSFVLDTSADPDTLMPVPDSVAIDTAYLDTTGSTTDTWQIETADIAPFLGGLPVDPSMITTFLPIIFLDRQTR